MFLSVVVKVAELREMLKAKGLNSVGNKQELIERLQAATSVGDLQFEDDLLNVSVSISTASSHFPEIVNF